MSRGLVAVLAALAAAALTGALSYWWWGQQTLRLPQVETRVQSLQSELTTTEAQKRDLEQRVEQVTKEQERLAQENALLRTQRTTEQLVTEPHGGPAPPAVPIPK